MEPPIPSYAYGHTQLPDYLWEPDRDDEMLRCGSTIYRHRSCCAAMPRTRCPNIIVQCTNPHGREAVWDRPCDYKSSIKQQFTLRRRLSELGYSTHSRHTNCVGQILLDLLGLAPWMIPSTSMEHSAQMPSSEAAMPTQPTQFFSENWPVMACMQVLILDTTNKET